MEKLIGLVLIAVYGMWFFTNQNVATNDMVQQEIRLMDNTAEYSKLTQSQMHSAIKDISEQEGWQVTEFKSNALIAEKSSDGNSVAVTITFTKSTFSISPENFDLKNAIDNALKTS